MPSITGARENNWLAAAFMRAPTTARRSWRPFPRTRQRPGERGLSSSCTSNNNGAQLPLIGASWPRWGWLPEKTGSIWSDGGLPSVFRPEGRCGESLRARSVAPRKTKEILRSVRCRRQCAQRSSGDGRNCLDWVFGGCRKAGLSRPVDAVGMAGNAGAWRHRCIRIPFPGVASRGGRSGRPCASPCFSIPSLQFLPLWPGKPVTACPPSSLPAGSQSAPTARTLTPELSNASSLAPLSLALFRYSTLWVPIVPKGAWCAPSFSETTCNKLNK